MRPDIWARWSADRYWYLYLHGEEIRRCGARSYHSLYYEMEALGDRMLWAILYPAQPMPPFYGYKGPRG